MGLLPAGVCVIALLSLFFLGRSQFELGDHIEEIHHLTGEQRIRRLFGAMLIGLPLTVVLVGVYLAIRFQGQFIAYASHAALALGVWAVLGLAFLVMIVITRLGLRPSFTTLAAAALAVPLAAYFTPADRFLSVFLPPTQWLPLATGLALLVGCYVLILAARKRLFGGK